MINGLSNLAKIGLMCSKGKLASEEISELVDDPNIALIDPAKTEVRRVEVDKRKHLVRIWFLLSEDDEKQNSLDVSNLVTIGFFLQFQRTVRNLSFRGLSISPR